MAGVIVELFDRRRFDFGGLGPTNTVTLSWWVDASVGNFTEGTFQIRSHAHTLGTGASMRLRLWLGAPSREQPQTDFFASSTAIGDLTLSGSSPAAPTLLAGGLVANFGGFLYAQLLATQGSGGGG